MNNLKLKNVPSLNNLKKLGIMYIPKNNKSNLINENIHLKKENDLILKKNLSKQSLQHHFSQSNLKINEQNLFSDQNSYNLNNEQYYSEFLESLKVNDNNNNNNNNNSNSFKHAIKKHSSFKGTINKYKSKKSSIKNKLSLKTPCNISNIFNSPYHRDSSYYNNSKFNISFSKNKESEKNNSNIKKSIDFDKNTFNIKKSVYKTLDFDKKKDDLELIDKKKTVNNKINVVAKRKILNEN